MSFFKFLKNLTAKEKKEEKDPDDFTNQGTCSNWSVDKYYCTECYMSGTHENHMVDICNHCGAGDIRFHSRTWRSLFINGKKQYQFKYSMDRYEIPNRVRIKGRYEKYKGCYEIVEDLSTRLG